MSIKNNDYCSSCPQKNGCKEGYERLGRSDAPSVVGAVLLGFVVPIGLFLGLLIGFDRWLPAFATEPLGVVAVFVVSAAITVAVVWSLKFLRQHRHT